jgi:uncharacterized membrane protein
MALRQRFLTAIEDIRASYWFIPLLMAVCGLALALVAVIVDARLGDDWLGQYKWLYGSRPEGARAMLSTIAGSTITVAGVVFSITLAAVTYASGQFGPRLLGNFMRDRGNQVTLGTFIGTYLYCLVVLRTIRSAGEDRVQLGDPVRDSFVPHIAMFGGLALAITSTAVLIYFVHHVTSGIHINNVIAQVGRDLIADIRARREDDEPGAIQPPPATGQFTPVAAPRTGYIETVDFTALAEIASRHESAVRMVRSPGDFVSSGWPVLELRSDADAPEKFAAECCEVIAIGNQRTGQQDRLFAIDELVEIAARALSPGVNDPFTAIACLDWLSAALHEIDLGPPPREVLADSDGTPRVVTRPLHFADYLHAAFGKLRRYVGLDPNARASALRSLEELARNASVREHRDLLQQEHARLSAIAPSP